MSKDFLILIIILTSFTLLVYGQTGTTWMKTYGGNLTDVGNFIEQTTDGGYIFTGYTYSYGMGESDIWFIKTDREGDTLWTKTFGGDEYDFAQSVHQTSDGGYVIIGSKDELYDYLNYKYILGNIWLIKTNAQGDTLWTKTYGGDYRDIGYDIQQTTNGGYIITGYTESFGKGLTDLWLIKTDSKGDTLWTKTFGGDLRDQGFSVQQTTDEGYIIMGYTNSYGVGSDDFWLVKTDSNGDTLWTKTFGGSQRDYSLNIKQTNDNGYIIIGTTLSFGAGEGDIWLIKTDSNGDSLWTKTFGGEHLDTGSSVQPTTDGGYIICGSTSSFGAGGSDVWLIKTDSEGDILWMKTIGGTLSDYSRYIQQTTDNGYIIIGNTDSFGAGKSDFWLIKTDAEGLVSIDTYPTKVPTDFYLYQNHPNPFNPSTSIEFTLPKSEQVELKVYNILGKEVTTLVSKKLNAGKHTYQFDGKNLASGVYYYQLVAGEFREVRKMILLR
jgi:hypothetical protein